MVDANESKKAEALWQTLGLSFTVYDKLFFLSTGYISVLSSQTLFSALSCIKALWPELACVLYKEFNGCWNFPRVESIPSVKSLIYGQHSLTESEYTIQTYHPPHFPSDLQLYTKELIRCPVYRPDYFLSDLIAPGSDEN